MLRCPRTLLLGFVKVQACLCRLLNGFTFFYILHRRHSPSTTPSILLIEVYIEDYTILAPYIASQEICPTERSANRLPPTLTPPHTTQYGSSIFRTERLQILRLHTSRDGCSTKKSPPSRRPCCRTRCVYRPWSARMVHTLCHKYPVPEAERGEGWKEVRFLVWSQG